MTHYYLHEKLHLEISKAYKEMYDTLRDNISLEEKLLLKKIAFENYILYLLLSPYFMDEVNLLNIANVYYRKDLEINMLLDELVKGFLGNEIISLHSAELFHKVGGYELFRKDITEESELHFITYLAIQLRNTKIVPDDNMRQWT